MKKNTQDIGERGFTLIEMMVVIVIIGILAMAAMFAMNSGSGKIRGASFRLRGDINLARAEAVNRNVDVLMQFLPGTPGYIICIDSDADNDCTDETGTDVIKDVAFVRSVLYYDVDAAGGPTVEVDGVTAWAADDGILGFGGNNYVIFQSNGTINNAGTVYLYYADILKPAEIIAGPFAVDVTTVGRVKLWRWNRNAWRTR